MIPLWNQRGQAPFVAFGNGIGGSTVGTRQLCPPGFVDGRCLGTRWLLAWDAYGARTNGSVLSSNAGMKVWLGGIMDDQQDASGLLYRRNRYYDPSTGRFTQEDPIGLAGGLNLYGFANGDPVTYSDPFGLCPEKLRTGDMCPGGLSIPEYERIQGLIVNHFDAEAGGRLQGMLEGGRVRRVRRTAHGREAEALGSAAINVADPFFATKEDGDAAWILGHEMGHNVQWEVGMFISEIGNANVRPNRGRLARLQYTRKKEADPAFAAYQKDADSYACAHVRGMVERQGHCTN